MDRNFQNRNPCGSRSDAFRSLKLKNIAVRVVHGATYSRSVCFTERRVRSPCASRSDVFAVRVLPEVHIRRSCGSRSDTFAVRVVKRARIGQPESLLVAPFLYTIAIKPTSDTKL